MNFSTQSIRYSVQQTSAGFTLLELIAAISIAAVVLAVSVPATGRMYQSVLYREAVGDVVTMLQSARYAAINTGRAQDVEVNPKTNQLRFDERRQQLPEGFTIQVHSASQLNRRDLGVIRFYPEGGSSGGGIDLTSPTGAGVKILVDWMVGRVTQERHAAT